MPKRKTFRKRHRKMNQKGGAPSQYWLKVTRRNQNDVIVEIIDSTKKNELCPSSSASGGGSSNPSVYNTFDDFVFDESNDLNKPLLLQLKADLSADFNNSPDFELSTLKQITADHVNWETKGC